MKPALATQLVYAPLEPGARTLDSFAGVATIPFEAALNGVKAYGFEISLAAYLTGKAKLSSVTPTMATSVMEQLIAQ